MSAAGVQWRCRHGVAVVSLMSLRELGLTYAKPHVPHAAFAVAWSFAAPRPKLDFAVAKSTPVLFEDRVIFGTDCGTLWGVEKYTGRIEWQMHIPDRTGKGIVSSPALHEGRVYVGGYDGRLYCVDARSGKQVWAIKCCDWIGSSPAIDGDRLYVGLEYAGNTRGGAVTAFDLDGKQLWQRYTTKQLHSSPIIHEGHVLTGTNDCDLWALTRDGELVSAVKTKGPTKYHVVAKGDLAVACAFDALYVWNWRTGEVLLRHETTDINYSRPLIVGDRAFCGSADSHLYVIDLLPVPHVVTAMPVGEKIHSSPALIDGAVWFGTSAGELMSIDPVNLDVLRRWAFPERLTCTPVSDGVLMYVHAYDNRIWAVKGIL
jgi:outer membrane protein assembly factor BamB